MSSGKVSIIIPVYNAACHVARAIESAAAQTYEEIEVILVDDGSTDESARICRKYTEKDSRVKLYQQKNSGVSAARNLGLKKATGEYIFFLDADDTIDAGVINVLVENYKSDELTSVMISNVIDNKINVIERDGSYDAENVIVKILTNELQGFACGYLFKKAQCLDFNEQTGYCEDMLFLIDYILSNKVHKINFLVDENVFYKYYQNNNSATMTNKNVIKKLQYIQTSMHLINDRTDNKYTRLINNKEVGLFEYELQHATKSDMNKAIKSFELPEYDGKSIRLKTFYKLFSKSKINCLTIYYWLRRWIRRILRG